MAVTGKAIFERLYLVLGLRPLSPCPQRPHPHRSLYGYLLISVQFRVAPQFFVPRIHKVIWPSLSFFLAGLLVVGTGFWTSILSPVFWAGLSQITRFWTYWKPTAVPVFKGRVND